MPDYGEMYRIMMRAAEAAVRGLIEAQQACEALYLTEADKKNAKNVEKETPFTGKVLQFSGKPLK